MLQPLHSEHDPRDDTAAVATYLLATLRARAAADGWTEAELVERFDPAAAAIVDALMVL